MPGAHYTPGMSILVRTRAQPGKHTYYTTGHAGAKKPERGLKEGNKLTNSATNLALPFKDSLWTLDLSLSAALSAMVHACEKGE
jgi:hypothetical protein